MSTRLHICSDDDCMNDSQTGGVCIKHGANQTMAKARRKHEGRTMLQEESLLESHGAKKMCDNCNHDGYTRAASHSVTE